MMQLEKRPSGLIAPAQPAPPEPVPPGTIKHAEERELAKKGIRMLVSAMRLDRGGGIVIPDPRVPYHQALYEYVSQVLLGELVEFERKC